MSKKTTQELKRLGENCFANIDKINSELFTLTYGAMVVQLLDDAKGDCDKVNEKLTAMGYNMGVRLIDEFLVRSNINQCADFMYTAEVIAKVALKMFLGITGDVIAGKTEENAFVLRLPAANNPFIDFVELPDRYQSLVYANVLCGIVKGALEMVQLSVSCKFVSDVLRGDASNDIEVTLLEVLQDRIDTDAFE